MRLLPHRQLPPYSYVPGKFPHPLSDEAGHSHGLEHESVTLGDDPWHDCEQLRWGIDLFNHGYYWEAHEAWEQVWLALGRKGPRADLLKALIKLAAAGVKARENRPRGILSHARRADELFNAASSTDCPHLAALRELAQTIIRQPDSLIDDRDDPVVVVMPSLIPG